LDIDRKRFEELIVNAGRKLKPDNSWRNSQELVDEIKKPITDQLAKKFQDRYVVDNGKLKREKPFPVKLEIAIARIQRALTNFTYDKDTTLFYTDGSNFTYAGKQYYTKGRMTVKVFPEEKNAIVAVFEMDYNSIKDTISNKDLYGRMQAENDFQDFVSMVGSTLSSKRAKNEYR